jgi:ribosome recycling factor
MREELLRSVKKKAELTRNNLRNARRSALDELKKAGLPKDDQHREQQQVQKVTDDFIAQVDKAVEAKEKDITEG